MRKAGLLSALPFCIVFFLLSQSIYAHTINQHLEELYGESYLSLFILSKTLPFIGLGMLSSNRHLNIIPINNYWMVILGMFVGLLLALLFHELSFMLFFNHISIILFGVFLLATNKPHKLLIQLILVISGCTLAYEYSLNIAHTHDFRALFIGQALLGLTIFLILSKIHFYKHGTNTAIRIAAGFFLVLGGIIVVLLS